MTVVLKGVEQQVEAESGVGFWRDCKKVARLHVGFVPKTGAIPEGNMEKSQFMTQAQYTFAIL